MSEPTPDLIRAVRAGCHANDPAWPSRCRHPGCDCKGIPAAIRAALAELAKPSAEMLAEGNSAIFGETPGKHRRSAEVAWRAMMRKLLGGDDAG